MASGASILDGVYEGLFSHLSKEVVFSLNDNIKFVDSTVAMFGDWYAYRDRFELFSKHPLVIGRYDTHIGKHIEGALPCPKHDGLILLKCSSKWNGKESLVQGLYSGVLTGAFALNLAIRIGFKQVFLLGFDNCAINGKTHWYDNVEGAGQFKDYEGKPITGVGFKEPGVYNTSFYNKEDVEINNLWKPFEVEFDNCMIYNVSLGSRINVFQKIGYNSMFKILKENPIQVNQEEVQKEIRQLLEPFNKLEKE
jgi:hypothetical protein